MSSVGIREMVAKCLAYQYLDLTVLSNRYEFIFNLTLVS